MNVEGAMLTGHGHRALPVLYSFRRCPYAIRARLALKASGLPVVVREIVLRDKPPEMLALSPKGTVPVLHLPDGSVIDQSLDIMRWALAQHDPLGWLSAAPAPEVQHWTELNDIAFKPLLDRYKYPERHPEHPATHWRDQGIETLLAPMNSRLARQAQLLGEQVSLADMALLPFVRQFAQVDAAWFAQAPLPGLQRWLAAHLASPLFESVMHKLPVWAPGAPEAQL
jgi:glutathione S-transferase